MKENVSTIFNALIVTSSSRLSLSFSSGFYFVLPAELHLGTNMNVFPKQQLGLGASGREKTQVIVFAARLL